MIISSPQGLIKRPLKDKTYGPLLIGFMTRDKMCNKTASLCNQYWFFLFGSLPVFSQCQATRFSSLLSFTIDQLIYKFQLTDDLEYIHSAVETAIVNCQEYILKNASFYDNTGKPPAFITSDLCPLQCSGHGTCTKGVCHCNSGFTGDSCSIDSRKPPTLYNIIR